MVTPFIVVRSLHHLVRPKRIFARPPAWPFRDGNAVGSA
jgi:hypothetical protein